MKNNYIKNNHIKNNYIKNMKNVIIFLVKFFLKTSQLTTTSG